MTPLSDIAAILRGAQRIGIAAHVRPDGDAVGSVLGLALSLRALGKTVHALLEDGVPENLAFLPGAETILQPAGPLDLDVAVALDTANYERLGAGVVEIFGKVPVLVNMDHHPTNPLYGHHNHIASDEPAAGQIVYELLSQNGLPVDDGVRQNLFAAISTDTGSFQFASTTARSHEIAAEMIRAGLDIARLSQLLYHTFPLRRLELQRAMLNEMAFRAEGRIASWQLTQETQQRCGVRPGDTEGLIDTLRMIDSVVSAVVFEELKDGKVRVSARSKDSRLDVSAVCGQFGGGGHRMAAGARLPGPIPAAAETFLQALEHEVRRLS
ncbi:MAG TPA: hypothetical protein DIT64_19255 [Verrucomicrobiales bacterium]|nr:hypothetical protein [Verrucomicrobiales bacterium]